jgi:DNA-directed RNA polymerase specialized sigma24 family protein
VLQGTNNVFLFLMLRILSSREIVGFTQAQVLEGERRARLIEALKLLGENHRLVLVLKYLSGLTEAEIGEVLGVPVSTVKSRLFVARKQLGQKLALIEGGDPNGKAQSGRSQRR